MVAGLAFQLLHARLPLLFRLLLWPVLALEAWLQACSAAALAARAAPATAAPAAAPPGVAAASASGAGGRAAASPARARPKAD